MDLENAESGTGDAVNGVDRILVGSGLAAIALLPTYAALIAKPETLVPNLDATAQNPKQSRVLGPGVFFVLGILFAFLVGTLVLESVGSPDPDVVSDAQKASASYAFGTAIGTIMVSLEDTIASGDFWNAVAVALPVFGFAVALAFALRLLLGLSTPDWTSARAMGASLYIVGGLLIGTTLSLAVGVAIAKTLGGGPVVPGLISLALVAAALAMTAVQAYGFAKACGATEGAALGLGSAAVPVTILFLLILCAFVLAALGSG